MRIEYSSASLAKDLDIKTAVYAEDKIPEYWIVNLETDTLIIFREPISGQYASRQNYTSGSISPIAFPDVKL